MFNGQVFLSNQEVQNYLRKKDPSGSVTTVQFGRGVKIYSSHMFSQKKNDRDNDNQEVCLVSASNIEN